MPLFVYYTQIALQRQYNMCILNEILLNKHRIPFVYRLHPKMHFWEVILDYTPCFPVFPVLFIRLF